MDKEKVLDLAKLSRISISDAEAENLSNEFEGILNYVSDIKKAEGEDVAVKPENFPLRNIMRDDNSPHQPGQYTKEVLENTPQKEGNYIKVKNIL
jgi:aspartyl/glutamyl-tRNA(Asn/Gln) amidotransferase C subunit